MVKIEGRRYLGNGRFEPITVEREADDEADVDPNDLKKYRICGYKLGISMVLGDPEGFSLSIRSEETPGSAPYGCYLAEFSDGNRDDLIFVKGSMLLMDLLRWVKPAFDMIRDYSVDTDLSERIVNIVVDGDGKITGLDGSGALWHHTRGGWKRYE